MKRLPTVNEVPTLELTKQGLEELRLLCKNELRFRAQITPDIVHKMVDEIGRLKSELFRFQFIVGRVQAQLQDLTSD